MPTSLKVDLIFVKITLVTSSELQVTSKNQPLAKISICSIYNRIHILLTQNGTFHSQLSTLNSQLLTKRVFPNSNFRPFLRPPDSLAAKNGFFEGQKMTI
jgi:hypothetical protein